MRNYYVSGDWNALCQRCGFKYKASQLKKEWTGLHVCSHCWEPRQPLDLIRVREDKETVSWASPEPTDIFVTAGDALLIETDNGDGDIRFMLLTETGVPITTET